MICICITAIFGGLISCDSFRRSVLDIFDCHLLDLAKQIVLLRRIFDVPVYIGPFINKYFIPSAYLIKSISSEFLFKGPF